MGSSAHLQPCVPPDAGACPPSGALRAGTDDLALFELANVGLWVGDLSALKARVDGWRDRGVADVRDWLAANPREVHAALGDMRMLDCNACAVELCEGDDAAHTIAGYPRLFLPPDSYEALYDELQAILDERGRFEFEATIRTLRGMLRQVLIGVRFPSATEGWSRVVVTMLDVTTSRRTEHALRESQERFRLAVRAVHGHIYDVSLPSRRVWRSDGLVGLVGFQPDDVPSHPGWWTERIHPDDAGPVLAYGYAQIDAGAESYDTRYRVRHRDGHYVRVWDRVLLVRDPAGQLRRVVGSVTDVTAEEQAFLALRESQAALEAAEERSRLALDAARLGTFDYDLRTGSLHWDARTRELFGAGPSFVPTYESFVAGVHRADRAAIQAVLDDSARREDRGRYEAEFRYVGHDTGVVRRVRAYGRIAFEGDAPVRVIGTVQDVTEQRDAAERLRAFADSMPQLAWVAGADGRNEFTNRRWAEYTGAAHLGPERSWLGHVHPDDLGRVLDAWRAASASGQSYEVEYRLRRHDGAWRWFLARGIPQRDAGGAVTHWFGTSTDVDEAKRLEQALRANEHGLREADRRKDEFLATLAHELRNPLAPIRSAAKILGSPRLGERELAWSRDVIARQVQHMARLLDDLLDISRITRGRLELRRGRVGLAGIVDAAVETARPLLDARRHTLHVALPDPPPDLDADPVRLAQVLANLLTNAAKYTDPGGRIELHAQVAGGAVQVAVRDDGIGLAPEQIGRVFDMFSQVTTALDRSEGGLGIGLALVRGLVELHGGRVEARSDGPGRGSEFLVVLPLPAVREDPPRPAENPLPVAAERLRRVLVADDNRDAAESLRLLLGLAGHEVRVAHDGPTALEIAAEFRPDTVLLDIGMPGLNGYEVATRLRALEWGGAPVLVAITGWGQEQDRRLALEAGFDHHLTKPIDPDRIEALLAGDARRGSTP
jgi:two-component system CheB/CheR fusion protein